MGSGLHLPHCTRIVRRDPVTIPAFEMSAASTIRDLSLAPEGERKIQWVAQHAHTLNSFARSRVPISVIEAK